MCPFYIYCYLSTENSIFWMAVTLGSGWCGFFILFPNYAKRLKRGIVCFANDPHIKKYKIPEKLESLIKLLVRLAKLLLMLFLKIIFWIIGLGLLIGLCVLVFKGITALPVSVAVIIGAIIIAVAIKAKQ